MNVKPAIFVTGGSGFLGSHFLRLMVEEGFSVTALARPTSKVQHLSDLDIEWVTGDVTDAKELEHAVREFTRQAKSRGQGTWFVHGAAVISYASRSKPMHDAVNAEGTRNALDAARVAGVDRMLHVSSVVGVGVAPGPAAEIDEQAPFEAVQVITGKPYISDYMRTKELGEQYVREAAEQGLDVVTVNPGAIFGEAQEPSNTAHIFKMVDKSLLGRFAGPGSLSVVGVSDVAMGMKLALERGAAGQRYLLCERNLGQKELMEAIARELGHSFKIRSLGHGPWRVLIASTSLVDRFFALEIVTPDALRLLALHFRFDSSKARRELGWCPRPFDEVLHETADWLRRIGLVGK